MSRLRTLRLLLGQSQEEASSRAGCTSPTWRTWESGERDPDVLPVRMTAAWLPGCQVQAWLAEGAKPERLAEQLHRHYLPTVDESEILDVLTRSQ